jgi:hypothetical protein
MMHRWKQVSEEEVACMDCGLEPWQSTAICPISRHPSTDPSVRADEVERLVAAFREELDSFDDIETVSLGWKDAGAFIVVGVIFLLSWAAIGALGFALWSWAT